MTNDQKTKLKSIIINWVLVPVFGGILISFFTCSNCLSNGNYQDFWASAIMSSTFWLVLSEGNSYLGEQVDKFVTWLESPLKRFIVGVIVLLIYTTIASFVVLYLFIGVYYQQDFLQIMVDNWQYSLTLPLGITIFIALTMHGREFLMSWRQTAINYEKLKSENIATQYESLKNQVNPHFLFNSLNALSSLVYSDQDKAVDFIRKLSEVYRYVLDHQMDEVVTLEEELEFVDSFVFLNKIRFGKSLKVDLGDFSSRDKYMIPPLALQMLLENCFKHNVVSKDNNLQVDIYLEDEFVVVKNNLNPKKVAEHSTGLGLNNIKSRFSFLTEKAVEIIECENSFAVKIPLLKSI
jgi:two-component system LytT family sensor kinase